jgi:roadblock/LC7 domain-containing protein
MTINLDKLMSLDGAVASGEFGKDGELVASKLDASQDCADLIEMMTAAKAFMSKVECRLEGKGGSVCRDMEFAPVKGLALTAGEYSICVMGNIGLFLETSKADFKGVFKTLGRVAGVV